LTSQEAEEELVAGYQTEYSGMKFALFYLGSYINLVLSALLVSILYLGGWGFPIPVEWLASWLGQPIDAPLVQLITGTVGIVMTVLKAYLAGVHRDPFALDHSTGQDRSALGSWLEVPVAFGLGEPSWSQLPSSWPSRCVWRLTSSPLPSRRHHESRVLIPRSFTSPIPNHVRLP
jgi:hypothetical protein